MGRHSTPDVSARRKTRTAMQYERYLTKRALAEAWAQKDPDYAEACTREADKLQDVLVLKGVL